jgi:hypothetical protein
VADAARYSPARCSPRRFSSIREGASDAQRADRDRDRRRRAGRARHGVPPAAAGAALRHPRGRRAHRRRLARALGLAAPVHPGALRRSARHAVPRARLVVPDRCGVRRLPGGVRGALGSARADRHARAAPWPRSRWRVRRRDRRVHLRGRHRGAGHRLRSRRQGARVRRRARPTGGAADRRRLPQPRPARRRRRAGRGRGQLRRRHRAGAGGHPPGAAVRPPPRADPVAHRAAPRARARPGDVLLVQARADRWHTGRAQDAGRARSRTAPHSSG